MTDTKQLSSMILHLCEASTAYRTACENDPEGRTDEFITAEANYADAIAAIDSWQANVEHGLEIAKDALRASYPQGFGR